jgi:uroporphyrinogen-III synthase
MRPRILVTRPCQQAPELSRLLRDRGLEALEVPTVAIDRDSAASGLDEMLHRLDGADWLVVTSANGAQALLERMAATQRGIPPAVRIAAVGPATAAPLTRAGLRVDHVPERYLTVAIADGLGEAAGRRVVLARADAATPDLREVLQRRGAHVEEVVAYHTVEGPPASRDDLRDTLARGVDGIAFTSGSTVRGLISLTASTDRWRATAAPAYAIGPVTARAAEVAGFRVAAVAARHTADGLADTIAAHLRGDR